MSYLFVRKFTEKERQEERLTVNRLTQKACLLREDSTEDDETGLTGDDVPLIAWANITRDMVYANFWELRVLWSHTFL